MRLQNNLLPACLFIMPGSKNLHEHSSSTFIRLANAVHYYLSPGEGASPYYLSPGQGEGGGGG
jgi:hypothetical protein